MHFQALTRSLTRQPRPFPSVRAAAGVRSRNISTTSLLRTQAGYGDPQDEKIQNSTPTPHAQEDAGGHAVAGHGHGKPSSAADPQPDGKGKDTGSSGGTTDPEIKPLEGNANKDKEVGEKEIRETKKIGEDPKKEEVGGAGVIGG